MSDDAVADAVSRLVAAGVPEVPATKLVLFAQKMGNDLQAFTDNYIALMPLSSWAQLSRAWRMLS